MTTFRNPNLTGNDESGFQRAVGALADMGLPMNDSRRTALAAVFQFGWWSGEDGVAQMLWDAFTIRDNEEQAAAVRRWVRDQRETATRPVSHRATFLAPENHPEPLRWRISDDGKTFHHFACDQHLEGGIDRAHTSDKAAAHHHACEAVRDV